MLHSRNKIARILTLSPSFLPGFSQDLALRLAELAVCRPRLPQGASRFAVAASACRGTIADALLDAFLHEHSPVALRAGDVSFRGPQVAVFV